MRIFVNAWLRRWAEASLRQELHQAQDKLIRQQEINARLQKQMAEQSAAHKKKLSYMKSSHKRASSYDTKLIRALRERMSEEMFESTAAFVRINEDV